MSTGPSRLGIREIGGITVATFVDSRIVEDAIVQKVGNELFALADDGGRKKVVLDFGRVEYLSSAALAKLIRLREKMKSANRNLRLCCLGPEIWEVFNSYYPDQSRCPFDIKPTLEEALKDF